MKRKIIVERCCADLKRYLKLALVNTKGGVISVKLNRVLEVSRAHMWKAQYAHCLSKLLRNYRLNTGLYVLTRQQVEELLNSLDALCAELLKGYVQKKPKGQSRPVVKMLFADDGERMPMVSFYVPCELLQELDEYARRINTTRSDVVRLAIKLMLDKLRSEDVLEDEKRIEYAINII